MKFRDLVLKQGLPEALKTLYKQAIEQGKRYIAMSPDFMETKGFVEDELEKAIGYADARRWYLYDAITQKPFAKQLYAKLKLTPDIVQGAIDEVIKNSENLINETVQTYGEHIGLDDEQIHELNEMVFEKFMSMVGRT